MRKRLSDQETEEAIKLIKEGVFYTEIAAKLGITKSGVFRIAKRNGVWSPQQKERAAKLSRERMMSVDFRRASSLLKGDPRHTGGKNWKITAPDGAVHFGTNLFSWINAHSIMFAPIAPEEVHRRVMSMGNRHCRRWRRWTFEPAETGSCPKETP